MFLVNVVWFALATVWSAPWVSDFELEPLPEPEQLLIDDFTNETPGAFPKGWGYISGLGVKKSKDAAKSGLPYKVLQEDGNRFMRLDDTGQSHTVVKDLKWDLRKYPCIQWRWRVQTFPEDANERVGGKKDTAASILIIFRLKKTLGITTGFVSTRYLWSNEVPQCENWVRSSGERNIVLQSGGKVNEWVTETVNVYEHYKKLFGKEPPKKVEAIGLRTDANSTKTQAVGDYDDIILLTSCEGQCD